MTFEQVSREVVRVCKRIYDKGWVANHDGNVTVRIEEGRILATPTAISKGDITAEMLLILDMEGKKIHGDRNPFSEIHLHLAIYRARSDVKSVLHAHPPFATSFAVSGISLEQAFIAEAVVSLGKGIPTIPHPSPFDEATAKAIFETIPYHNAILIANHGAITVGDSPWTAFLRMELVEHLAMINFLSRLLGNVNLLPSDTIEELLSRRRKAGLEPPGILEKEEERSKGEKTSPPLTMTLTEELVERIVSEEMDKILKN